MLIYVEFLEFEAKNQGGGEGGLTPKGIVVKMAHSVC